MRRTLEYLVVTLGIVLAFAAAATPASAQTAIEYGLIACL
jgi:hypothetical protein